ncbi:hypothetical protein BDQ12DRAFT_676642 [Crucibulum laeve]|uniref:Phosphatidylinositol N-acetylglucosaminyltransferase subunit H conserved domain-containing protein n=1 Tax=Crucibulum laeve TaxID=68775 RepID=A0A5C3MD60_9AGAR|nr:hypothetical protein BDQ12DRAFT_676642 [Crucibulum laeve]
MQHQCPLPDSYPQFSVLDLPGYREYRVENWRLAKDGTRRVLQGTSGIDWQLAFISLLLAWLWAKGIWNTWIISAVAFMVIWFKGSQVICETAIVLPPHGIQLETHRGFPSVPLTITRRFIPFVALRDVVINEGLRRWNVNYHLLAISDSGKGYGLDLFFENLLPQHHILFVVYQGIHELLPLSQKYIHPDNGQNCRNGGGSL